MTIHQGGEQFNTTRPRRLGLLFTRPTALLLRRIQGEGCRGDPPRRRPSPTASGLFLGRGAGKGAAFLWWVWDRGTGGGGDIALQRLQNREGATS